MAEPSPSLTEHQVPDPLERLGVALADPTRRRVLTLLTEGPRHPSDLADACGTTRSNLSNHLACLRGCGLVVAHRQGRRIRYHLAGPSVAALLKTITATIGAIECRDHLS